MTNQTPTTTPDYSVGDHVELVARLERSPDLHPGQRGVIRRFGGSAADYFEGREPTYDVEFPGHGSILLRAESIRPAEARTTKRVDVGLGPAVDVTYDPDRGIVLASDALDREVVLGPAVVDAIRSLLTDTTIDGAAVLACPMSEFNDAGAENVGGYLRELLRSLVADPEGFSGNRPFGNSDWKWYELAKALVEAELVSGEFDDEGMLVQLNEEAFDDAIEAAINAMGA